MLLHPHPPLARSSWLAAPTGTVWARRDLLPVSWSGDSGEGRTQSAVQPHRASDHFGVGRIASVGGGGASVESGGAHAPCTKTWGLLESTDSNTLQNALEVTYLIAMARRCSWASPSPPPLPTSFHPTIALRSRSACSPIRGRLPSSSSRSLRRGTPGSSDRLLFVPFSALSP